MKIGIIGWGLEGQSAYHYFGPEHDYLIVNEHPRDDFPAVSAKIKVQFINAERTPGVTGNVQDLSYLDGVETCDKVIYSVTNAKNLEQKFGKSPTFWTKATTTQHLFYENVKTKKIIGVTGTKGKGTTSTLIYRMLRASGKIAFLGGNIGTPVLDFINKVTPEDWVVLELSSFQLYNLTYSPHIAVCLMVVPEHLDWHPDMQDYTEAKANLVRHQKAEDTIVYFPDNEYSAKIASYSPGQKIPYTKSPGAYLRKEDAMIVIGDTAIIHKSQIRLLGEHNIDNICAAITAFWQIVQDIEPVREVLTTFTGLEHRLEMVRDFNGVKYYDDSFGTTPDTAIVAMKAFAQPKVVILGGSDKGVPFEELAQTAASSNVRHVITIGQTGPAIAKLLKSKEFTSITEGLQTMPEIVAAAQATAQPGDIVLLSTGCASFGMFKDYKDRGQQFKNAVQHLK